MPGHPLGVSFLVCVHNGAPRIAQTLTCLAQQAVPIGIPWEVVFVDNASTDGTTALAQQTWDDLGKPAPLRTSLEPRLGYKVAMERAISQIRYRYACIVDDDNRLASDYMRIGLEILENNPRIGILGGQNSATFDGKAPEWFPAFQHCYAVGQPLNRVGGAFSPLPDGEVGRNVLWGAGMFVRTEVWTQLRGVGFKSLFTGRQGEANLTAGEDDELCYAALLLGYEVWYSTRLHLRHHMAAGRLTTAYRDRLFYASARSTTRLNAYRNALWGNPTVATGANLAKDLGYALSGQLRKMLAPAFIRAAWAGSTLHRMLPGHALSVVADGLLHFGRVKGYYEHVGALKRRLAAAPRPTDV